MIGLRLQKAIAEAGLASRRAAEEMIRQGRVAVNGQVVTELGIRVDPQKDEIRVDDRVLSQRSHKIYVLFYKPKACVTTLKDPQGRKTILDFLPQLRVRLFPVGRLDYDAEGLLLLTNDGPLAHRLQHPRFGVPKVYEVKVEGHPGEVQLDKLRNGVALEEGNTAPAQVVVLRLLPKASWMRITLHQGWNRQIKRMGQAVGLPVLKIKRTGYGPLSLGDLTPGKYRLLEADEVRRLYQMVHLKGEPSEKP
jgi:23S rRNA pseudouridine2605 synthase